MYIQQDTQTHGKSGTDFFFLERKELMFMHQKNVCQGNGFAT